MTDAISAAVEAAARAIDPAAFDESQCGLEDAIARTFRRRDARDRARKSMSAGLRALAEHAASRERMLAWDYMRQAATAIDRAALSGESE